MKIVFAILLSLSLYAPSLVKLAAYTDCSMQIIANTNAFFCDCSKVIKFSAFPYKDDAVKNASSLNTDWKYIGVNRFQFFQLDELSQLKFNIPNIPSFSDAPIIGIFRPPIV